MTLEEFQSKITRRTAVNRYCYYALCFLAIMSGFYILVYNHLYRSAFLIGFILLLFGVYGLTVLQKKFRLIYWHNDYTEAQNIRLLELLRSTLKISVIESEKNFLHFRYSRRWWGMPYKIYLFADEKLIAINVDSIPDAGGGFVDFGASARTEQRILDILYKMACQ